MLHTVVVEHYMRTLAGRSFARRLPPWDGSETIFPPVEYEHRHYLQTESDRRVARSFRGRSPSL